VASACFKPGKSMSNPMVHISAPGNIAREHFPSLRELAGARPLRYVGSIISPRLLLSFRESNTGYSGYINLQCSPALVRWRLRVSEGDLVFDVFPERLFP
jgi:hypothetical protein